MTYQDPNLKSLKRSATTSERRVEGELVRIGAFLLSLKTMPLSFKHINLRKNVSVFEVFCERPKSLEARGLDINTLQYS